jgi:hypothetical protein
LRRRQASVRLLPMDDRDMQTVMETLFDIKVDVGRILDILEDENGEEEEEEDS